MGDLGGAAGDDGNGDGNNETGSQADRATTLTLLTYNDVQTAAAQDGNFPRMVATIDRRRAAHDNPVVVAGGDDQVSPHALSPVSSWHAPVGVLNEVDPAADVIGNHDLDYGFEAVSDVATGQRPRAGS